MRRIRIALAVILVFLVSIGQPIADELEYKQYFPVIANRGNFYMGRWNVVIPEVTRNRINNTSFEYSTWNQNWINTGTNPPASADETGAGNTMFGSHSAEVTFGGANSVFGTNLIADIAALNGQQMTISAWVRTTGIDVVLQLSANFVTYVGSSTSAVHTGSGEFERLSATFTPTFNVGGATTFIIVGIRSETNLVVAYLEAVQLELKGYVTTYCDGDQDGCEFLGETHNSHSQRSALSAAGGRVTDLTDLRFEIGGMDGTGVTTVTLNIDSFAILPGGEYQSKKLHSRTMILSGVVNAADGTDIHDKRQTLIEALNPSGVLGDQPVLLRYTGASVTKEIGVFYSGGLDASLRAEIECWERLSIRFVAPDPFFYALGEESLALDTEDSATLRYIVGRLRDTGQWDPLGPPASGAQVLTIAVGPDGQIYIGGTFAAWEGNGNESYITHYDPLTGTWDPLGTGMNAVVQDIVFGPDGTLYACGDFTDAGGVAVNRVATWTDAGGWADPASPAAFSAQMLDMVFASDGNLYIVGTPAGARAYYYNGAAWTDIDAGFNGSVIGITEGPDGTIYVTGAFTADGGGGAANRVAQYDGSWSAMGSGLNAGGQKIIADDAGLVYAVGSFTTAGGNTANRVAVWNGTAWSPLGTGLDNTGDNIDLGPDGILYVTGLFTTAGGITIADGMAKWNGSSWAHLDIDLPGASSPDAITIGRQDPVIVTNYDIFVGFITAGAGTYAGLVTVTNEGTQEAFPRFTIARSGGTSAILESIRNETTGKELLFDYALQDGETLTIDLVPPTKTIESSFFGLVPDAILANSDFGTFSLIPGDNDISCYVLNTGATVTGFVLHRETFQSQD